MYCVIKSRFQEVVKIGLSSSKGKIQSKSGGNLHPSHCGKYRESRRDGMGLVSVLCRNGFDMIQSQPVLSSFKLITSFTFSSLMFQDFGLDKF